MDAMKQAACGAIDNHSQALAELSHDIWSHPEIAYKEKHAHDVLTSFLEGRGFSVDRHFVLVCYQTSFVEAPGCGATVY